VAEKGSTTTQRETKIGERGGERIYDHEGGESDFTLGVAILNKTSTKNPRRTRKSEQVEGKPSLERALQRRKVSYKDLVHRCGDEI